jgi:hypothetical protein
MALLVTSGAVASGPATATLITAGTPVDTVPAGLVDPFFTLGDPLAPGQYLVPIHVTGAVGLVEWRFDLGFDAAVVAPLDLFGLFGSVYQAEFRPGGPVTEITSSGLALSGLLDEVSGFFFPDGVDGDGTLAFVLFGLLDGGSIDDAGIEVLPPDPQTVPVPGTAALAATALAALALFRRHRRRPALHAASSARQRPRPRDTP